MAAVLFPTGATLPQVRQLDRGGGGGRLLLAINPQWQPAGQVVSDFGCAGGRPPPPTLPARAPAPLAGCQACTRLCFSRLHVFIGRTTRGIRIFAQSSSLQGLYTFGNEQTNCFVVYGLYLQFMACSL